MKHLPAFLYIVLPLMGISNCLYAQDKVHIVEEVQTLDTYPFSDPSPVANPNTAYYPYFRYDGFTNKSVPKEWKTVIIENEFIKVTLFPEIGGKIWGAVDKKTQKEFIYYNHTVKFRDIAMRGPWTSGGIEFNFGVIGHAPTTSAPIDYLIKKKEDGSASCFVSSYDWITRTVWSIEINLQPDKAFFTTHTTWFNQSATTQPYYQWMNAAYKAKGNAQFCYPGTNYIKHSGQVGGFPVDFDGHAIGSYAENDFGNSKSYHILGKYDNFHGILWKDENFGSIHVSDYDQMLGRKIFLWGLSREGAIWENLLTDSDGQYIELQAGRMFNQPASGSTFTPYKHFSFAPYAVDDWTEYWFPIKQLGGVSKANSTGALYINRSATHLNLSFLPLGKLKTTLSVYADDKLQRTYQLDGNVLKAWKDSLILTPALKSDIKVIVGDQLLVYSENDNVVKRPKVSPTDFDWNSLQGLAIQGEQWTNQKKYKKALVCLNKALEIDPYYIPALQSYASIKYATGKYTDALRAVRTILSINTYQGKANYLYGLVNEALGNSTDAKDGFAVAAHSWDMRSASYTKLSELYLAEGNYTKAKQYATQCLGVAPENLRAKQLLLIVYRKTNQLDAAHKLAQQVLKKLPLYHPIRFEASLIDGDEQVFPDLIKNEFSNEVYLELATWYMHVNCLEEAIQLLDFVGQQPIALYQKGYIYAKLGENENALSCVKQANALSPSMVFPFRPSTLPILEWAEQTASNWKIRYYEGLIYWANLDTQKALVCMDGCKEVDFAAFYLSRALLKVGDEQLADLLLAEKLEQTWRTGFALQSYYVKNKDWPKASVIGKKYFKKFPHNYYIGLKYAKALCESKEYTKCIKLLDKLRVLPNEGAYAGRAVYRAAHLFQAMDLMKNHRYKKVVSLIEQSKIWPENLGVGKPYDSMIDSRLESYLVACVNSKQQNESKANVIFEKIANYNCNTKHFDSNHLLTAIAMRTIGRKEEADSWVQSWNTKYANQPIAKWCNAIYNKDFTKANELLKSWNSSSDATPWETSYRDANVELIIELFSF